MVCCCTFSHPYAGHRSLLDLKRATGTLIAPYSPKRLPWTQGYALAGPDCPSRCSATLSKNGCC